MALLVGPAAAGHAEAGLAQWSSGGPILARTVSLAVDPGLHTTVYAGTLRGVFKSTDGGGHWSPSSAGLPDLVVSALAVDPQTPTTLFAATSTAGVFRSTDGGAHWSPSNAGLPDLVVSALAVDPQTPTTLFAATSTAGVFRSTDGGAHWSPSNAGIADPGVDVLAVDPRTPATLYAGSNGAGVFKSIDGGAHWNASNAGLASRLPVSALALDPQAPSTLYAGTSDDVGIFKSVDGGAQWGSRSIGLTTPSNHGIGLALDPQRPATLYASTDLAVFKSTDSGAHWDLSSTGLPFAPFLALAVDPQISAIVYVGSDGGGVFKSADGGAHWSAMSAGLSDPFVRALIVDPQTPTTLYAGTWGGLVFSIAELVGATTTVGGGVFKSTDGGAHWSESNVGLPTTFFTLGDVTYGPFAPTVYALAVDPQTPAILYAGTHAGGVFRSTDGGAHWSAASTGLPGFPVRALAVDPQTPATVYAGTDGGGVFRSTDRGDSWTSFNPGLADLSVNALQISPSGACVHAATEAGVFDLAIRPDPCAAPGPLVAAVLPSSRSVQVGSPASAFVTVINAGGAPAAAVAIALRDPIPATLTFWTTDPHTNAVTGPPDAPVDIAPLASQTYVIVLAPTEAVDATEVAFFFAAINLPPVATVAGVNTLLLSASATPVPDIVALSATMTHDGIVDLPGTAGTEAFAVATVNVGREATITASADTGSASLPVDLLLCQTDAATGQCLSAPAPSVPTPIGANATSTFSIFVTGTGAVPFDPAINRVFVRFRDEGGVVRGATSVAVRTR